MTNGSDSVPPPKCGKDSNISFEEFSQMVIDNPLDVSLGGAVLKGYISWDSNSPSYLLFTFEPLFCPNIKIDKALVAGIGLGNTVPCFTRVNGKAWQATVFLHEPKTEVEKALTALLHSLVNPVSPVLQANTNSMIRPTEIFPDSFINVRNYIMGGDGRWYPQRP